ncbi:hypothetical protein GGS21DRAFT_97675 [Xylaria nigripes]|nr:hypothetical protein GGS21DRAFT_97675 [Xylaria nigripes]
MAHAGTMTAPLSQLASQVPRLINEHSKRRRDSDPFSLFFDYGAYYEGEPPSPGTRSSRSVVSSEPGLTSGPSEEDGAPSPGPTFDTYHKEAIREIKQQDDRFTVPEREIRPKGGLPYPPNIHLDNMPSPTGSSSSGNNIMFFGIPVSPTMFDLAAEDNHSINRGKRTKPLENREKVAGMRKLGACYRCKVRKVTCDEGTPCSTCIKDAAKVQRTGCNDLAEQMCFRQCPTTVFSEINNITCANMPSRGKESANLHFDVFFQPVRGYSQPLRIKVSVIDRQSPCPKTGDTKYQLCTKEPLTDGDILQWASSHMNLEGDGTFQSALDDLVESCPEYGRQNILPHSDLLQKVRKLRCFYEVWRQNMFFCRKESETEIGLLPEEIRCALRAVAAKRMKGIEDEVLKDLAERPKSPSDGLPLWACTMQLVLLYRDLCDVLGCLPETWKNADLRLRSESLMNYAVVMCDLHFGKKRKKPTLTGEHERHLSDRLDRVKILEAEFLGDIRLEGRITDRVLAALLAKNQKCSGRSKMPPPSKRLRK